MKSRLVTGAMMVALTVGLGTGTLRAQIHTGGGGSGGGPCTLDANGSVTCAATQNGNVTLQPSGTGATVINNFQDKDGQVYNVFAYGVAADEQTETDGAMTSGSAILTSASGAFKSSDVGKAVIVNGAGASSADLSTTIFSYQTPTQVTLNASAAATVTSKRFVWGTDNTTAINNLLTTVYNAGGGIVFFPRGFYLVLGAISLPNNGAATPYNATTILEGTGPWANGVWVSLDSASLKGATVLDMRYAATTDHDGRIESYGVGYLEIKNFLLADYGTDCGNRFVFTQDTTLNFHNNAVSGTLAGTSACTDGVRLGGASNAFQGYGTDIHDNFFDKIRSAAYLTTYANAVVVRDNTVSKTSGCGNASFGAFTVTGTNAGLGNYFAGNLVEDTNYHVAFLDGGSGYNVFVGNTTWDASAISSAYNLKSTDILITGRDDELATYGTGLFYSSSQIPQGFNPLTTSVNTLGGTTAGNLYWSMPGMAASGKTIILNFQGFENTSATPQTVTFPAAFSYAPSVVGCTLPAGITVSTTGMSAASMSGPFTAQCIVEGQ